MLAPAVIPAVAALGLAGCASATTTCVVRHGYAIVIFQNGVGNSSKRFVTRFRVGRAFGCRVDKILAHR